MFRPLIRAQLSLMMSLLRSKRRQILLTCFVFPLLFPLLILSIGVGAGVMLMDQSSKVGVMSEAGGISVGIQSKLKSVAFENAMSHRLPNHAVQYFDASKSAEAILAAGEVTYLISGDFTDDGNLNSLQVLWLKTKEYPQMHWLTRAEDALPWLVSAYMLDKLGYESSVNVSTYSVGLGEKSSNVLFYGVTAILWMFLIYYAFDILRGFMMKLYENEEKQDLLRHCVSLKVPAYQVVFARLISMLPTILIGVGLLFTVVRIVGSLYTIGGSAALATVNITLLDRTAQTMTVEFFSFFKALQLHDGLIVISASIVTVITALAIQQIFCVYTKSTDSARTYSKGLEIGLISIPFIVFISGPYIAPYFPFAGIFKVLQDSLEGNASVSDYIAVISAHTLLIIMAVGVSSVKSLKQ